jgi:hypothetical protein
LASLSAARGTLCAVPSSDPHRILCAAAWAPAENDGSWDMMFAVRHKALVPANETPARRTLVRWETEPALVLSVAPLLREANARVNDSVILRESDVGTSLDVIHSIFGCFNSASSRRRGCQKSVSPSGEKLRVAWGIEWESFNRRQRLSTDSMELQSPAESVTSDYRQTLLLPADRQITIHKDKKLMYTMLRTMYSADPPVLYTCVVTIRITRSLCTSCLFAAPYIYISAAYSAVLFLLIPACSD